MQCARTPKEKMKCLMPMRVFIFLVLHFGFPFPTPLQSSSSFSLSSSLCIFKINLCELATVAMVVEHSIKKWLNFENFNFKCDRSLQFQLQFEWINNFFFVGNLYLRLAHTQINHPSQMFLFFLTHTYFLDLKINTRYRNSGPSRKIKKKIVQFPKAMTFY